MKISPIVLLFVAVLGCDSEMIPSAEVVIEAAIRESADKVTGELNKADLEKVTELSFSGIQITNLGPLAGLTKLEVLRLHFNQITDLTPLAGLTELERLSLLCNQITNLKPLAGLTKLEWLWLSGNQITDLTPLEGLTKLEVLWLDDNPNLTKAEIDKLQKALPNCEIIHNATK